PWATRAAKYLPPIKTLTLQKWTEIFSLAKKYQDPKGNAAPDIFENSTDGTDGDESSEGYTDPRSRIIISDDEFEEGGNDGPESDFGMFNAGSDDDNNEDIAGSPGPVPEADSEMPLPSDSFVRPGQLVTARKLAANWPVNWRPFWDQNPARSSVGARILPGPSSDSGELAELAALVPALPARKHFPDDEAASSCQLAHFSVTGHASQGRDEDLCFRAGKVGEI
ncbi:hypothetical protein B0H11DRAFT_1914757, partial [Mycena galericulata]